MPSMWRPRQSIQCGRRGGCPSESLLAAGVGGKRGNSAHPPNGRLALVIQEVSGLLLVTGNTPVVIEDPEPVFCGRG